MIQMFRAAALVCLLVGGASHAQIYKFVTVIGDETSKGVEGSRPLFWEVLNTLRAGQKFTASAPGAVKFQRCDQLLAGSFRRYVVSAIGQTFGVTDMILQCGHNDIIADRTADQICGPPEAPGSIRQMVNEASAKKIDSVVLKISPWGSNSQWTSARQAVTDAVNTCIASLAKPATATTGGVSVVEAYTLLGQTSPNQQLLRTDLDDIITPDGLHWDPDGHSIIGNACNAAVVL